jgi:hypothetical protein
MLEDTSAAIDQKICKRDDCIQSFSYIRKTKVYCSANCRKRANELTQNSQHSLAKRSDNMVYWDRVNLGMENLLKQPNVDRASWLQAYIDNPTTAKITGNPALLRATPSNQRYSERPSNNIAKIANRFTQQVYRVSIKTYIKDVRDQPDKDPFLYDWSIFEVDSLPEYILYGYDNYKAKPNKFNT